MFARMLRRLLLLALSLLGPILTSCADRVEPTKNPILFSLRLEDSKTTHYLYGTMHVSDPRVTTLPASVERARNEAAAVYLELPFEEATIEAISKRMFLEKGSIEDRIPKDVLDALRAWLAKKGHATGVLDKFKPWALVVHMALFEDPELTRGTSLDEKLYTEAKSAGKEVGGIETVDEQIGGLASFSDEDCAELIRWTLEEYARFPSGYSRKLLGLYLEGQLDEMLALLGKERAKPERRKLIERFEQRLLIDRNQRMAKGILERVRKKDAKAHFFAIGALHLAGKQGLPALLRAAGAKVERLGAD